MFCGIRDEIDEVKAKVGASLLVLAAFFAPAWTLVAETPVESVESVKQLIEKGRYADAEAIARELLVRTEAESGATSLEVGHVLDRLVEALWRGGRLGEETVELAERAVAIHTAELGPEHPDVAVSLNHLGNVFLLSGRYARANEVYLQSLAIREKALGPDHFEVATSLNNLAQVQYMLNDFAGARVNLEQALAIREKHFGPDHPKVAHVLTGIGRLLYKQGDLEGAKSYSSRSLQILEAAYGSDHIKVLRCKSDLAGIMTKQGDYVGAIPVLDSLLEAQIEGVGVEHLETLRTMNKLGVALEAAGEMARAKPVFERLMEIRRRVFPDHPRTATAILNYGEFLFREGRLEEARKLFEQGLLLRERWNGVDHLTVASALIRLAELNLSEGRVAEALDAALRSESIAREQFQQIAASLSEREALRFELVRASGLDVAIAALAGVNENTAKDMAARVWDSVIRSRAMVLDEIATRRRELRSGADADVDSLREVLTTARNELARLLVSGAGMDREQYLEDVQSAQQKRARAERALAEKSLVLRRKQARRKVGLSDVAAALPPETALVAYTRYHRKDYTVTSPPWARHPSVAHYLALILEGGDSRPCVVDLGPSETIDKSVLQWKAQVGMRPPLVPLAARHAEARYRELGEQLRRLIWDPVAVHLGKSSQVIVVPEGSIHLVGFSTLPMADREFLVEVGPAIHHLSAERDLVREPTSGTGSGLLALGGPDFGPYAAPAPDSDLGCDGLSGLEFPPLHSARTEVEGIAALWKESVNDDQDGARVLTGDQASEAAIYKLAPGRRVLHLATHGFFAQSRCESVPQTDPGGTGLDRDFGEETARRILHDPLLLSGLAFAGANLRNQRDVNQGEHDGILTAEEVASLDLSGVEWVVLSACETGLGEVQNGEGVLGLRRAFETAGVDTLIMSLWAVEDQATQRWMNRLYRERLDGKTTIEAVRIATVESIRAAREARRTTHPFYWGAFTAVGDWR